MPIATAQVGLDPPFESLRIRSGFAEAFGNKRGYL